MQANPTQDDVRQRMEADAMNFFTRNAKWLALAFFVFFMMMVAMLVVLFLAVFAAVNHHDGPCDQPLKYYLLTVCLWSFIPGHLQKLVTDESWTWQAKLALHVVCTLPGWGIIGWGVWMITSVKTCPKTNPGLYYPTRNYIIAQLISLFVLLAISTLVALGARRVMLYVAHLSDGPGCVEAVRALPKVAAGAPELLAEDGEVKACPICIDALSDGAVITPCKHYFHEDCLATWCASHLDCPLCRQPVGDPDSENKGADAV
jgi:hypothetical protein